MNSLKIKYNVDNFEIDNVENAKLLKKIAKIYSNNLCNTSKNLLIQILTIY